MINWKGDDYHYQVTGKGPAILLVHGFAEDSRVWDQQVPHLSADFQVITVDIPGSHANSADSPPQAASMEEFAEGLQAILDQEKIDQAILIGHSMGGYISLAFAAQFPDRLRAFGLFHSTALSDSEERKTIRRRGIEFIQNNGAERFLEQSIPNLFSEDYKKANPATVQACIRRYAPHLPPAALIRYYEAMIARPDRTTVLQTFPRPILFVLGRHDGTIPPDQLLPQTHLPAISVVEILEKSGHMGMLEETERTNALLHRFCRDLVPNA